MPSPSQFLRVRGARWFDYVVLADGLLVAGQRIIGYGHANLALGEPVQAAGQVQISGGQVIEIDNASGHYLPIGPDARRAALLAFRQAGFAVSEEVYVAKTWNQQTLIWEPADGSE